MTDDDEAEVAVCKEVAATGSACNDVSVSEEGVESDSLWVGSGTSRWKPRKGFGSETMKSLGWRERLLDVFDTGEPSWGSMAAEILLAFALTGFWRTKADGFRSVLTVLTLPDIIETLPLQVCVAASGFPSVCV